MDKNTMDIKELATLIAQYKKLGNEEVTLKTDVVLDLIKIAQETELKVQLLLVQKTNLVFKLRELGVEAEEVRKILRESLRKE